MKNLLMSAIGAIALGAGGAVVAGESLARYQRAPDGVSGEVVRTKLEGMGYRVDRLEAERDCWEVRAVNDSGLPIKAKYDLVTGDLIQARLR